MVVRDGGGGGGVHVDPGDDGVHHLGGGGGGGVHIRSDGGGAQHDYQRFPSSHSSSKLHPWT